MGKPEKRTGKSIVSSFRLRKLHNLKIYLCLVRIGITLKDLFTIKHLLFLNIPQSTY